MNLKLLRFIQRIHAAADNVVEFEPYHNTPCPVCRLIECEGAADVIVVKSAGEVRYCYCRSCGTHFTAIGKPRPHKDKETSQIDESTKAKIITKKIEEGERYDNQHTTKRTRRRKRRD